MYYYQYTIRVYTNGIALYSHVNLCMQKKIQQIVFYDQLLHIEHHSQTIIVNTILLLLLLVYL